jgi:Transport protein Trs120 or TRAPPC9, TRAPP II complex subunit
MTPSSFILPAQSLHTHSASFIPRETGQLLVKGCTIKFSGCKPENFSIWGNRNRRERDRWYDTRDGEFKIKRMGVGLLKPSAAITTGEVGNDRFWLERTLHATVLAPQPVLVLDGCLFRDACMSLLEGET